MGSRPRSSITMATRRARRRSISNHHRRLCSGKPHQKRAKTTSCSSGTKVSDKLEALKNLIPSQELNGDLKADQLFQDTAKYIVLLKTQVSILQKLVDFYGSSDVVQEENLNAV